MSLRVSSSENIGLQKVRGVADGRSPSPRSCATADRSSSSPPAAIRRIASSTDVFPELLRPANRLMRSSRSISKSLKRRKYFTRRFSITVAPSTGCRSRVTPSALDCPGGSRQSLWPHRFRELTLQGWNSSATRLQFQYQPYLSVRWNRILLRKDRNRKRTRRRRRFASKEVIAGGGADGHDQAGGSANGRVPAQWHLLGLAAIRATIESARKALLSNEIGCAGKFFPERG